MIILLQLGFKEGALDFVVLRAGFGLGLQLATLTFVKMLSPGPIEVSRSNSSDYATHVRISGTLFLPHVPDISVVYRLNC